MILLPSNAASIPIRGAGIAGQDRADAPSLEWVQMAQRWALIESLNGGTLSMREAGELYLPREEREAQQSWEARVNRSILYGGYKNAVRAISGKPFSKEVTLTGSDFNESIEAIELDADRNGQTITDFSKHAFRSAIDYGLTAIYVEMPKLDGKPSKGQVRRERIHPYFVHVPASHLIGFRYKATRNGPELTQARWLEETTEDKGEFGSNALVQVRVVGIEGWATYVIKDKGAPQLTDSGKHRLGVIPLVVAYTNKTGFMRAEPALEDLAWKNLEHWQSASDQRNILRIARRGILFRKGVRGAPGASNSQSKKQPFTLSTDRVVDTPNVDADMKWVEHTGRAAEVGRQDGLDIKQDMVSLALQPLTQQAGTQTATEKAIDEGKSQTEIQAWIRSIESAMRQAYGFAAKWLKTELPEDFAFDIFSNFSISERAAQDVEALIKLRVAGELPRVKLYQELTRRGIFSDDTDPEGLAKEMVLELLEEGPNSDLGDEDLDPDAELEIDDGGDED